VAVNTAVEAARFGVATLLADADTYGASIAQVLGLLDEAPGLAAAVRRAASALPSAVDLARHARQIEPNLRVLTGLGRADRWPELRPAALSAVWAAARDVAALTIVDVGFALEQDEELSYDVAAPRRNAATIVTLQAADLVVVVGSSDPIGVQRLIRGVDELRATVPGCSILVVVNRVRRGLPGGARAVGELLHRHAAVDEIVPVPDDAPAVDSALVAGRPLADVAPRSVARTAIRALAARVVRSTLPPGRRGQAGSKSRSRAAP
jgi:MinD-like ATPase involved in chromosome partitioning or flagellar assembly